MAYGAVGRWDCCKTFLMSAERLDTERDICGRRGGVSEEA